MTRSYLTKDLPASGGVFKASPEDFEVEELPAYLPSGEPGSEHLFLWVEKRGRSTPEVAKGLSRALGLDDRAVSWAGLKDRQAVTRQWLCVPAKAEAALPSFAMEGVKVLEAKRHRNKLKNGHLKGNRFRLWLRGVADAGAARASLERMQRLGVPNFFGDQRFGAAGDNAARGKAILLAGGQHRDRFERKLLLSAYQSELFNRVLARRLDAGALATVQVGDVLKKHETGGEFVCEEPSVDQPRAAAFEVSPTGPLFGPSMRAASGEPGAIEAAVLAEEGLTVEAFLAGRGETEGARRLLRVPLSGLEVEAAGADLRVSFTLPSGSYATEVLREVLKEA